MHTLCNHLILSLLQFGMEKELLPTTLDSRIYNSNEYEHEPPPTETINDNNLNVLAIDIRI